MTVTASQKIINELAEFEFEVVYQNTSNIVIKTNKGHHVSITLDKQGYYTLYRCSPDSFGGFDFMATSMKEYRTMKSINKWIIKRHVDTSEEFEVSPAPIVEKSNDEIMSSKVIESQQIINQLSGFEFEVVKANNYAVVINVEGDFVSVMLDPRGNFTIRTAILQDDSTFKLISSSTKQYRDMKHVNKWIIKRHVDTSEKQETALTATPAPVVEESKLKSENKIETETMQVSHENGQIVITSQSGDRLAVSTDDTGKLNVKFLGIDEAKKIATPTSAIVCFTEAPIEQEIFESAKELDDAMEDILNAPDCDLKDGCYYKTDVTIEFDDGESWHGRINYEKDGHFDSRLVEYFQYYQKGYSATAKKPARLSQEEFESRVKFYGSRSII